MAAVLASSMGKILYSDDVLSKIAGLRAMECYGVVGMASKQVLRDGWTELLKKENYSRGVVVRKGENGLEIDLYIIVSFGVRISEVVQEAQKKVKYVLEKTLNMPVAAVNVFVQSVRAVA